jgi:RNA-binding protein 25
MLGTHCDAEHFGSPLQHTPPAKASEELKDLLDSDTDTFVIKLYRTVIFETERAAAGL